MLVDCLVCSKKFVTYKSNMRAGSGKHCSRGCASISKSKIVISEATRRQISAKLKGKKPWNVGKTCPQLSAILLGKKGPESRNWKGGNPHCVDCDKEITPGAVRCNLDSNRRKSGESHYRWQGGITPESKKLRNSWEYKQWRMAVFERDGYTCTKCGAKNGSGRTVKFNADHIKPFALYPELRFSVDNGRTLCIGCHKQTNTFAGRVFSYVG